MKVELTMTVRGEVRIVRWADGRLTGDAEIIRRLQPLIDGDRIDTADLLAVVRGLEQVTAQHVTLVNLDLVEPGSPERSTRRRRRSAPVPPSPPRSGVPPPRTGHPGPITGPRYPAAIPGRCRPPP